MSSKITTVALMAVLSAVCLAGPMMSARQIDTIGWTSVEFQGATILYNATARKQPNELQGPLTVLDVPTSDDTCGASSFGGTPSPWPLISDCAAIRDYAYSENVYYGVWTNNPDYHGVLVSGTCAFGAGTRNILDTYLGSSDIGDLISTSIQNYNVNSNQEVFLEILKAVKFS